MSDDETTIPLEPFPVAIATGARVAAGRGLIATRAIAAGEVVLRCAPLLVALDRAHRAAVALDDGDIGRVSFAGSFAA